MSVSQAAEKVLQPEPPPPSAAEAKVRIWTAILIDGETNQPVERVPVEVRCWKTGHRKPQPLVFTSGSGGEIKIPLAAGTATSVQVKDSAWWSTGRVSIGAVAQINVGHLLQDADPAAPVTITLWKGTTVRGKLLKPDGTPAVGTNLNLSARIQHAELLDRSGISHTSTFFNRGIFLKVPNWQNTVVTDDDGTFSIAIPPADVRDWLRIDNAGGWTSAWFLHQIDLADQNRAANQFAPFLHEVQKPAEELQTHLLDLGTIRLKPGVVVKGRVLDAEGKPLAGIGLFFNDSIQKHGGRFAKSAADGSFASPPLNPGETELLVNARLTTAEGDFMSNDKQALFLNQTISIPDDQPSVEFTLRAIPHVNLEFEWIDRRAEKRVRKNGIIFSVSGRVKLKDGELPAWQAFTDKVTRDGREFMHIKVPAALIEANLNLSADQVLAPSYEDDEQKSGPGHVALGDVTKARRRIIYGDDPPRVRIRKEGALIREH
jgi:hypothetical protein